MYNDYTARVRSALLNRVTAYGAAAAAVLALSVSIGRNDIAKTIGLSAAAIASGVALANHRQSLFDTDIAEDHETAAQLRRERDLMGTATEARQPTDTGVSLFDWTELANDRARFPAVFISGKPGSGKTTLAEYLGAIAGKGKRYVISPHLKPTDFVGFDGFYGAGANFLSADDVETGDFRLETLTRESSIFAAMNAFTTLVYDRLVDYSKGVENFEPIDLYIDETIAINLFFRKRCPVKQLRNAWGNFLAMLLTEPRKVGLRVWLLTQAQTVGSMGLEGFNELKSEMVWIRLNHNAINHAKRLRRSKTITDAEYFWLSSQPRPILVDEFLASAPSLLEQKASIKARNTTATPETVDAVGLAASDVQTAPTRQDDGNSPAALSDKGSEVLADDAAIENIEENTGKTGVMHGTVPNGDRIQNAANAVGISVPDCAAFYARAAELVGTADPDGKRWTKTRIVSEVWSGLPRAKARSLYDALFGEVE